MSSSVADLLPAIAHAKPGFAAELTGVVMRACPHDGAGNEMFVSGCVEGVLAALEACRS